MRFEEVMSRVEDVLSSRLNKKIYDADIAQALGILPVTYATRKKRNAIPFDAVLGFCVCEGVSADWVFFGVRSGKLADGLEIWVKGLIDA